MIEDLPVMEICIGGIVLLLIVVIIILILRNRPFTYKKRSTEKNTTLTIVANKNLHRVTVQAKFGNDQITFERKRIRKGQTVEFTYPISDKPAKITVEIEPRKKPKVYKI